MPFLTGVGAFTPCHPVQIGSGVRPAFHPMGTEGPFPRIKAGGGMRLTTHLHLVPRLRMHGAIPPLP